MYIKDVEQKVFALVSSLFPRAMEPISRDSTWLELGADSLDIVEAIIEAEALFQVQIPEHACDGIDTVGKLIDAIALYGGATNGQDKEKA